MEINTLNRRPEIEQSKRLTKKYGEVGKLIAELKKKDIPAAVASSINQQIEEINSFSGPTNKLLKRMNKAQASILELVEKELKLVSKNYYRNRWLAIGMSAFGIPFGVVFGVSLGNMAFVGIGIPIGMAIGIAIGTAKDKEANASGHQLDIELPS